MKKHETEERKEKILFYIFKKNFSWGCDDDDDDRLMREEEPELN